MSIHIMDTVVLSSSADGTTILWDLALRSTIGFYKENTPLLRATAAVGACVTPSGTRRLDYLFFAQSGKPAINIYTWNKDTPLYRCAISETPTCISISSDGTLCCIGTSSGKIVIWDIPTGELIKIIQGHFKAITCICISSCGNYIVTGGQDAILHVWDTQQLIDIYYASSSATTITNDSNSSSNNNNINNYQHKPIFTYTGHTLPLTQVYFLPGNIEYGMNNGGNKSIINRIITASLDRTVRILDIPSNLCLLIIKFPSAISTLTINNYGMNQSSNQYNHEIIYAGCIEGNIYSINTLTMFDQLLSTNHSTTISSSSLSSSTLPTITINSNHLAKFIGHTATITTLSLTPDNTSLLSGSDDGTIKIWDLHTYQCIYTYIEHHTSPIFTLMVIPRPPHLALTGKHALLPLLPLAPLRKHLQIIPLDYQGSTIGPTNTKDRNRIIRIYSHLSSSSSKSINQNNSSMELSIDNEFHENIMILQALNEQEQILQHHDSEQLIQNNNNTANNNSNDQSKVIEDLQARINILENENTRWKDVNNKLVTQLKTLQKK